MMNKLIRAAVAMTAGCTILQATETFPGADELRARISKRHPRIFLTPETVPQFKAYANSPAMKKFLDQVRRAADEAPETPALIAHPRFARIEDGRLIIPKKVGNQDMVWAYLSRKSRYGKNAVRCTIMYLATGDKKYFDKAVRYLDAYPDLLAFCRRNRIMVEWYHTDRLAAVTAYDWLYNELTPEQRKRFIEPLVDYMVFITGNPGYITNGGPGRVTGNYGERGFLWHAALAAMHDGYAKPASLDTVWKRAYKNETETMSYREKMSAGTGLLTSICTGYCFGYYPFASFNFLHTLKSATGIDGTRFFPQMRDYAKYFDWMAVPAVNEQGNYELLDYGWGDSFNTDLALRLDMMYTHLAQMIHFFGQSSPETAAQARAMVERLPAGGKPKADLVPSAAQRQYRPQTNFRKMSPRVLDEYPYLPFILTGFDPKAKTGIAAPDTRTGTFFPTYGLAVMRSGTTPQDTFASIKVGAQYDGHQHYDELSFVIMKQGVLTSATGCRDGAPHHRAYYAQTIGHNSPLIRMPDEPLPPHWYPVNLPKVDWTQFRCDGGQDRKAAGKNLGFAQTDRWLVTGGDATKCYSAKKCKEAVRMFVYIKPDYFVIYDRLESVKPDQQKVFVLHTQNELVQKDGVWTNTEFRGKLFTKTLLPKQVKTEVIGGPGKEFWTNGQNFPVGAQYDRFWKQRNFLGRYRLEISPAAPECRARMLHVLQAADISTSGMIPVKLLEDATRDGAELTLPDGEVVQVWFTRTGKPQAAVQYLPKK